MRKFALLFTLVCAFSPRAFSQIDSEKIDRLFESYNRAGAPGASVAVYKAGAILYERGYGLADVEANVAATPYTNFRLASLTKQFTAMAIMILKERGLLTYDTTLSQIFPSFPSYGSRITVRHLLGHLSGLRAYEDLIPSSQTEQVSDADVLALLARQSSTVFAPGSQYRYSNSGYCVLGQIVERISGKSFASFLREEIFFPLGMYQSVAFEDGISDIFERAYGYSPSSNGRFSRTDQSITSATLGDGGVYTSVHDYFRWDEALYGETLVSRETLQEAFSSGRTSGGSQTGYGFGWEIGSYAGLKRVSHTGSTIGFRTAVQRFPEQYLTVIVLVNRANSSPWTLAERVVDIVLGRGVTDTP
jgi:CubicO group peptidase (beta-lactamase class C family)